MEDNDRGRALLVRRKSSLCACSDIKRHCAEEKSCVEVIEEDSQLSVDVKQWNNTLCGVASLGGASSASTTRGEKEMKTQDIKL